MQQNSRVKGRLQGGRVSEKCLGTEVPVDCKSARISLMVLPGLRQKSIGFTRKGLGCIRVPLGGGKSKIPGFILM